MSDIDSLVNSYAGSPSGSSGDVESLVNRYAPRASAEPSGGDVISYGKEDEANTPGLAEATIRGAAQGVTLGFKDEAVAALESLLTTKTYKQSLAESRANDEKARKAHPWGFGIGEVLGGLATPGIGEAAGLVKGTGLAAKAARGAIVGGAAGLGNSDADLVGGDVGGAVRDTAKGALLGAGIGAIVGKGVDTAVGGAEERVAERAAAVEKKQGSVGKALDMGILFHNPVAYVAKKGGEKLVKAGAGAADEALAKLSRAVKAGDPSAKYIRDAIDAGAPRAAVAAAVAGASEEE